ncbi:hypothetical protein IMSAGC021_00423 [Muribaculaceae bacterium]|nr:hypothetical protein IMSAGC021_00423 [Muribaculaceae bacterium]
MAVDVVSLQAESLDHIGDYGRRLEGEHLVVDVCRTLEEADVAECACHSLTSGFGVFVDHNGGCPGVGFGSAHYVEHSKTEEDYNGNYEPFPFVQAENEEVMQVERAVVCFWCLRRWSRFRPGGCGIVWISFGKRVAVLSHFFDTFFSSSGPFMEES